MSRRVGLPIALAVILVSGGCFSRPVLGGWQIAVVNQSDQDYVARADVGPEPQYFAVPRGATVVVALIFLEAGGPPDNVAIIKTSCDEAHALNARIGFADGATVTLTDGGQLTVKEGRETPPDTPADFKPAGDDTCAAAAAKLAEQSPTSRWPSILAFLAAIDRN
jgi:hypothetical protein